MASRAIIAAVAGLVAMAFAGGARAQAGPPLITNDTGTPGPGKWEINLAVTGARTGDERVFSVPDADVNYGVGDAIQLSVHVAWEQARQRGTPFASGIGAVEYAVRWRFLDQELPGIDVAIQPHLVMPGSDRAIERGLSQPNREFVLPLQLVHRWGATTAGVELARHWTEHAPGALQTGLFLARDCAQGWQCLAEVNTTHANGGGTETLTGLGARRALSDHLKLMGAIERQVNGPASHRATTFYLGVQLTP